MSYEYCSYTMGFGDVKRHCFKKAGLAGRCVWHSEDALSRRHAPRLSRKRLEAIAEAAKALEDALSRRDARDGAHIEFCDCGECVARAVLRGSLRDSQEKRPT